MEQEHVLVYASDPAERGVLQDIVAEEGGYRVTAAATADEALAVLRAALRPLVIVLTAIGNPDLDTVATRILTAVRDAGDTWPAHRFVVWAWHVPPDLEELIAAAHVRWVLRPSPVEPLLEAVRAAAGELQAA